MALKFRLNLPNGQSCTPFIRKLLAQTLRAVGKLIAAHDVRAIVVAGTEKRHWQALLSSLRIAPIETGDVLLYKIPRALRDQHRNVTPVTMQARHDRIRYSALISGANEYLSRGFPLAKLTPWEAERLEYFGCTLRLNTVPLMLRLPATGRMIYGSDLGRATRSASVS